MKRRKRSKKVQLILLGGLSTGALAGCGRVGPPQVTTDNVYTNNFQISGVGYYHAPFHAWYQLPYNQYNAQTKLYFYGGQWGPAPYQSVINISSPNALAAQQAEAVRTDIVRGGFGGTSYGHSFYS